MDTTNYPNEPVQTQDQGKSAKNIVIAVLAVAFLGSAIYAVVNNNNKAQVIDQQQTQIAKVTDAKGDVQKSFDESLVRLDSMASLSNGLKNKLADRNKEIEKRKTEIRAILNKKNATAAELAKAKTLIEELNGKITGMEQQVAKLTTDNQALTTDNAALTQDKEKLTSDLTTTTTVKQELEKKVQIKERKAKNIKLSERTRMNLQMKARIEKGKIQRRNVILFLYIFVQQILK